MRKDSTKGQIKVLGIDQAKNSFQLHGVDEPGQAVLKKKLSRKQLTAFIAKLLPCHIGLEACGGAHEGRGQFNIPTICYPLLQAAGRLY